MIIIGGGDTGNDCVGTCMRHGCKSVTQIEMMPKAPDKRAANNPWPEWPKICKTDYGQEEAIAVFGHDPRIYESTVCLLYTSFPVFFQAVGSFFQSSFLTVLRTVCLFVPLGYAFSRLRLDWFWLTFPCTEIITTTVSLLLYRKFYRQAR